MLIIIYYENINFGKYQIKAKRESTLHSGEMTTENEQGGYMPTQSALGTQDHGLHEG